MVEVDIIIFVTVNRSIMHGKLAMQYPCRGLLHCLQHYTVVALCLGSIDLTTTTSTGDTDKYPYTEFCSHQILNSTNATQDVIGICLCMYNCNPELSNLQETTVNDRIFHNRPTLCTTMTATNASLLEHVGNMYMSVDKCPSGQSCYHFKPAPWGSLYPVYSKTSDTIYVNDKCAKCNNDTDVMPWQVEVNCPATSLLHSDISEGFTYAFNGALLQDSMCSFRFLPPEDVDLTLKLCFRMMNTHFLEHEKVITEYALLCRNVEPAYQYTGEEVESISCISCSNVTDLIHEIMCNVRTDKRSPIVSISFLLAPNNIAVLSREEKYTERNFVRGCRPYEAAERKTGRCRKVRCPEGKNQVEGNCRYVSAEWQAGPFVSFLRLEPLSEDDMLAMEHMEELSAYKGKFFKNNLKSWSRKLYYYTPKNKTHVQYFVLKLKHKKDRIIPDVFFKKIEMSLTSHWNLYIAGKNYQYKASIHKYFEYSFCSNRFHKRGTVAIPGHLILSCSSTEYENSEFLIGVRGKKIPKRTLEIGLTAFFLCRHVDLKPTEFVVLGNEIIYFNVTGRILESAEIKWNTNRDGDQTISVCMSTFGNDFWQINNESCCLKSKPFIDIYIVFLLILANQ